MVIWLIGLSGAGKTTVGRAIAEQWRKVAPNTVLVDGDEIRHLFGQDRQSEDYSIESRRANAERIRNICAWLDSQNINVVCCILSLFPDQRADNRSRFRSYYEVFLDAPMKLLESRDSKGLYAAARKGALGNVVGVDIPFPPPRQADLIIDVSQAPPPDRLASEILLKAGVAGHD